MNNKCIKSHIQLPASVLKEFSTRRIVMNRSGLPISMNMIFCMDLRGNITELDIKNVNVEEGYYTSKTEELLSEVEQPFGELKQSIKKIIKTGSLEGVTLYKAMAIKTIKEYCILCMIRAQRLHEKLEEEKRVSEKLGIKVQDEIMSQYSDNQIELDRIERVSNFDIIYTKGAQDILLPQSGFALGRNEDDNGSQVIYMPITPKIALALTEKSNDDIGNLHTRFLAREADVDELNKFIIAAEMHYSRKAIYAKKKENLEKYREYLLNIRK